MIDLAMKSLLPTCKARALFITSSPPGPLQPLRSCMAQHGYHGGLEDVFQYFVGSRMTIPTMYVFLSYARPLVLMWTSITPMWVAVIH